MSDLLNIGNEIASLWGASCYDYEIDIEEDMEEIMEK